MEKTEKDLEKKGLEVPIVVDDPGCLTLIEDAKALEFLVDHWGRRYHNKMGRVWRRLKTAYGLDSSKFIYRLDGVPPVLYCDGLILYPPKKKEEDGLVV